MKQSQATKTQFKNNNKDTNKTTYSNKSKTTHHQIPSLPRTYIDSNLNIIIIRLRKKKHTHVMQFNTTTKSQTFQQLFQQSFFVVLDLYKKKKDNINNKLLQNQQYQDKIQ
eukprot:TRINITY_DN14920_c0_g1_i1.p4 TRINITY_DN14920_c0_g1~~TRINITY_DN14920_c0_g1_i1.p4  ORF type:complete len:123 (+),score=2.16 TRINITY_DN14920_c0_g1_i1:38-370(+)